MFDKKYYLLYYKRMDNCISTKTIKDLNSFSEKVEEKFSPSTFKFVKIGDFFDNVINFLRPIEENGKDIELYLHEDDKVIDMRSIENDMAVVSKDLLISSRRYVNKCRKIRAGRG